MIQSAQLFGHYLRHLTIHQLDRSHDETSHGKFVE